MRRSELVHPLFPDRQIGQVSTMKRTKRSAAAYATKGEARRLPSHESTLERQPGTRESRPILQDWRFLAAAGAIVAAALFLRLHRVGVQELWIDEAFSFFLATTSEVLGRLRIEHHPPLHYLLLRGWVPLAGSSDTIVRLPSVLAGTAFVAAVIWAGREILDTRVGLWSGAFAAVAPIQIYYSQEARPYVFLALTLALTCASVWRAFKTNAWAWWVLTSIGSLAALYTHYFAILGLIPPAFLCRLWPDRQRRSRYLGAMAVSILLLLPWAIWSLMLTPHPLTGTHWIRGVWEHTPPPLAIPLSLEVFGLGGQANLLPIFLKQVTYMEFPTALRVMGLVILALLGIWMAVPWGDAGLGVPEVGKRKAWLASSVLLPLFVLWAISFHKPVYVAGRYDMVAFPMYPVLLGLGLAKVQRIERVGSILAPLVALLLLIPIGTKLFLYYNSPSKGYAAVTARILHASVGNGDVVVFTGLRGISVISYLIRSGYRWEGGICQNEVANRQFGCRMYPRETETTLGGHDPSRVLASLDSVREDIFEFMKLLDPDRRRLWVVFASGDFTHWPLVVPEEDDRLVQELMRLGLTPLRIKGAPGIFVFQGAA